MLARASREVSCIVVDGSWYLIGGVVFLVFVVRDAQDVATEVGVVWLIYSLQMPSFCSVDAQSPSF
jgi:hypothetical protein